MAGNPNRRPAGTPVGGQFAPSTHAESTAALDADPSAESAPTGGPDLGSPEPVLHRRGRLDEYRLPDGKLQDPSDGTPARRSYHLDGSVYQEEHYCSDKLQDPSDGTPAWRSYYLDGSVYREGHYRSDKLQDPSDGTPALRFYRSDGSVYQEEHYCSDKLQDPSDGTPALRVYRLGGSVYQEKHYPSGTPAGGQFAPGSHAESTASLDAEPGPAADDRPWSWSTIEETLGKQRTDQLRVESGGSLGRAMAIQVEAEAWQKHFSDAEADQWRRADPTLTPDEAAEWAKEEFTVDRALAWRRANWLPHQAGRWADAGFDPDSGTINDGSRWSDAGFYEPKVAAAYRARGLDPEDAKVFAGAGIAAGRASMWMRSGFRAADAVCRYVDGFKTPDDAIAAGDGP